MTDFNIKSFSSINNVQNKNIQKNIENTNETKNIDARKNIDASYLDAVAQYNRININKTSEYKTGEELINYLDDKIDNKGKIVKVDKDVHYTIGYKTVKDASGWEHGQQVKIPNDKFEFIYENGVKNEQIFRPNNECFVDDFYIDNGDYKIDNRDDVKLYSQKVGKNAVGDTYATTGAKFVDPQTGEITKVFITKEKDKNGNNVIKQTYLLPNSNDSAELIFAKDKHGFFELQEGSFKLDGKYATFKDGQLHSNYSTKHDKYYDDFECQNNPSAEFTKSFWSQLENNAIPKEMDIHQFGNSFGWDKL